MKNQRVAAVTAAITGIIPKGTKVRALCDILNSGLKGEIGTVMDHRGRWVHVRMDKDLPVDARPPIKGRIWFFYRSNVEIIDE